MSTYLYLLCLVVSVPNMTQNHMSKRYQKSLGFNSNTRGGHYSVFIIIIITVRQLHLGGNGVYSMLKCRFKPG